jgi:DNA-binding transcriptional ArsR family regulator
MVVDQVHPADIDRIFHALADGTRRDIVALAVGGSYSVSALAKRNPMSFAAVQKHVAVLEGAGLVTKERQGREQLVRTDVDTLHRARALLDGIEELWRARAERIDDLLIHENEPRGEIAGRIAPQGSRRRYRALAAFGAPPAGDERIGNSDRSEGACRRSGPRVCLRAWDRPMRLLPAPPRASISSGV